MARFVDLDLEDAEDESLDRGKPLLVQNGRAMAGLAPRGDGDGENAAGNGEEERARPPAVQNATTMAFSCYPIVFAIVSHIDLNTLDALARTSRLIHQGLIQYRTSLLTATLRCSNERQDLDGEHVLRSSTRERGWNYLEDGRTLNGGPGHCARDMVSECRKTCLKAPIATLANPPLDADLPLGSDAVQRTLCSCEDQGVWLCQPCGRSVRNADHEYKRIWRWRNQYGEILGGLGTGIGDGDRGVICGREGSCLAAREREHEIDCDAEDARGSVHTPSPGSQSGLGSTPPTAASAYLTPGSATEFPFLMNDNGTIEALVDEEMRRQQRTPSPQLGPGYERHEIEGIGGKLKRKLVKMVRVGACVPEWEEEKGGLASGGKVMTREISGVSRSWCGWCWRAVPGKQDLADG
ncbi:hypothetical protein ESCO_003470 [Escovopsis weberi]|uniref:Uncharacterized protein n=1 Tax=Escovopsis weberi TaxID=150374 RepID=A0A0M9VXK0_ESCWE|nr:hypothetical protein ESCO_003470 [Escovopsis weberi]